MRWRNIVTEEDQIFEKIEEITNILPIPICWVDTDNVMLGTNKCFMDTIGIPQGFNPIDKTAYDVYPKEMADKIVQHNNRVMQTGKTLSQEEPITDVATGRKKYVASVKSPIRVNAGAIVGMVNISIDITAEKEAERLRLETERQKSAIEAYEKSKKVAEQVAHDIRSPLASLLMIVESCKNIPEDERIALREVANGINDIANNLLSKYKKVDNKAYTEKTSQPMVISLAILEALSEKRYQYKNLPVKFNSSFEPGSNFAFIKINPSSFNRMVSNLINNAIEAFEGKEGMVDLKLGIVEKHVKVTIQDNGKGMPQKVIDKIMNNITVTSGKKHGSGIGFAQVRSVLQASNGKMFIESEAGRGTKIVLMFPLVATAEWMAKEINLQVGDTVVVLDDDYSIHEAWEMCFKNYKSDIKLRHFQMGAEAIKFISELAPEEKARVFLLSDFELINQELNGLQVVEKLAMQQRSILVTSHYNDQKVRDQADKSKIKILPKQLASEVPINMRRKEGESKSNEKSDAAVELKKVDFVVIDDDSIFTDYLAKFLQSKDLVVDAYYSPERFLEHLAQYAKSTKICMDNNFQGNISGIEVAKQLHDVGYTKLYLLSGNDFEAAEIPSYLTVMLKGDMEALSKLV